VHVARAVYMHNNIWVVFASNDIRHGQRARTRTECSSLRDTSCVVTNYRTGNIGNIEHSSNNWMSGESSSFPPALAAAPALLQDATHFMPRSRVRRQAGHAFVWAQ